MVKLLSLAHEEISSEAPARNSRTSRVLRIVCRIGRLILGYLSAGSKNRLQIENRKWKMANCRLRLVFGLPICHSQIFNLPFAIFPSAIRVQPPQAEASPALASLVQHPFPPAVAAPAE